MQELEQVMELNGKYEFHTDKFSFSVEQKGDKQKFITGYISTQDVDLYNDLVTPVALRSMLKQINESIITLDYEHEAWRDDNTILPVGKIVSAKIDSKGLWIKAVLNEASPKFKALWSSIKKGFVNAFSIAFKPLKTVLKTIGNAQVRLIEDLQLLNVAITGAPVNKSAKITDYGMKSIMLKAINDMEQLGNDCVLVPRETLNKLQELNKMETKDENVEAPVEAPAEEASADEPAEAEQPAEEAAETKDEAASEEAPAEAEAPADAPAENAEAKADEPAEESADEVEAKSQKILKELQETVDKQGKELKALKENDVFKSPAPANDAELKSKDVNMLSLIK